MKLVSWNVNGIRACANKGFFDYLEEESPDILCVQETKAHPDNLDETLISPDGYYTYWHAGERKGYSGTATFTRVKPKKVIMGQEVLQMDNEGRILMTEFESFILFNIYFPNGQMNQGRLDYKLAFYEEILLYFDALKKKGKGLIITGDVNTAHKPIDLARPKENENYSGFLPIERAWVDKLVSHGYVDTFRHFYPDLRDQYSWWAVRTNSRAKNIGWRIDYFFVTEDLMPRVRKAGIRMEVLGSDHAPVTLEIDD